VTEPSEVPQSHDVPRATEAYQAEGEPSITFEGFYKRLFDLYTSIPRWQSLENFLGRRVGISPLLYFWSKASKNTPRPPLVLETIGRSSGQSRQTVLPYWEIGDEYVVTGTGGGAPVDPHWVRNLRARPDCAAWIKRKRLPMTARVATDEERERFIQAGVWHSWMATYQYRARQHGREVPFIALKRSSSASDR
jgi:deazaflavin-dependent oxidoreductase (nitroreductase family)